MGKENVQSDSGADRMKGLPSIGLPVCILSIYAMSGIRPV
jgi:hypothetical protein